MKVFLKTVGLALVMTLIVACGSKFELFPEENIAPLANAGANQSVVVGDTVTLDGSASSDDNGDKLHYGWSLITQPSGSTAALSSAIVVNPTFIPDVAGDYIFNLTVNDGKVSSATSTVTITASVGNAPPVANAGADQSVATGAVVTLDGSASSDANADTLTYAWTITSLPSGSTATITNVAKPTFTADKTGDYEFKLIVNDGTVNSTDDSVTVTATAAVNIAPVAYAGLDQTVTVGTTVQLDGSGSSDLNEDALSYIWSINSPSCGTLSSVTAVKPTLSGSTVGACVISLKVFDEITESAPDSVTINVITSTGSITVTW